MKLITMIEATVKSSCIYPLTTNTNILEYMLACTLYCLTTRYFSPPRTFAS